MSDEKKIDPSKPFDEQERKDVTQLRDHYRQANVQLDQRLQQRGYSIDTTFFALQHTREMLVTLGIITEDQRLGMEAACEVATHKMLRDTLRQITVAEQRQALATPAKKSLIVPGQ